MAYVTALGQTWDMIARDVYGNEMCADFLMENNPDKLHIFIFSAGVVLNTPEMPEKKADFPPWRAG